MPDIKRNGVVVYSYKQNESWRAEHSFFHIDPLFTDYNIDGINFQWNIGVFGMTLGKPDRIGFVLNLIAYIITLFFILVLFSVFELSTFMHYPVRTNLQCQITFYKTEHEQRVANHFMIIIWLVIVDPTANQWQNFWTKNRMSCFTLK